MINEISLKENIIMSVCITTYNMEKYIGRLLETVLMQQVNFDYEIIVADDCSVDNTITVLQKYQQKFGEKFKIIYAGQNGGTMKNLVKGLKACKGKFIALADADDYWIDENKLQQQFDILNNDEAIGFVHTNCYRENDVTKQRVLNFKTDYVPPQDNALENNLWNFDIAISTSCIRKSLLDYKDLDYFVRSNFFSQDYTLFLYLIPKGKQYYISRPTAVYSVIENSRSRNTDMYKRITRFQKIREIGKYFAEKNNIGSSTQDKFAFAYGKKILLAAWATHNFSVVKKHANEISLKQIIRYHPAMLYIYFASRNKFLYQIFSPWLLRKRKFS